MSSLPISNEAVKSVENNSAARNVTGINKPCNVIVNGLYNVTKISTEFKTLIENKNLDNFKVLAKTVLTVTASVLAAIALSVVTLGVGAVLLGREIIAQRKERAAPSEQPPVDNNGEKPPVDNDGEKSSEVNQNASSGVSVKFTDKEIEDTVKFNNDMKAKKDALNGKNKQD